MLNRFQKFGNESELLAAEFLENQGYTIIEKNYRNAIGEIDLIAKDGETLVFAEVKARSSARYGNPKEALTYSKQKKISKTAMFYLKMTKQTRIKARFDVVAIHPSVADDVPRIELVKNAFNLAGL
jgi:putative endonuclease